MLQSNSVQGWQLGLVLGGFAAGALLGRLTFSVIASPKIELTSIALIACMALCASQIGQLMSPLGPVIGIFRVLNGFANATLFYVLFLGLAQNSNQSAKQIGAMGGGSALALVAGSPLGLLLLDLEWSGSIFLAGSIFAAMSSVLLYLITQNRSELDYQTSIQSDAPKSYGVKKLLLALLCIGCALGALEVTVPLISETIGRVAVGASFALFGVAFALGRLAGGRIATQPIANSIVVTALLLISILCIFSAVQLSALLVVITAMCAGGGLGLGGTVLMVSLRSASMGPASASTLVTGQLANDIGLGIGIFAASSIASFYLEGSFIFIVGACAFAAFLSFLALHKK